MAPFPVSFLMERHPAPWGFSEGQEVVVGEIDLKVARLRLVPGNHSYWYLARGTIGRLCSSSWQPRTPAGEVDVDAINEELLG
jgi:hypothetical protein